MVQTTQVDATLTQLERAQQEAIDYYDAQGVSFDAGIDITNNRAEIYMTQATRSEISPVKSNFSRTVEIVTVDEISTPMAFYGGSHLTYCTAGFVVKRDGGGEGVTTAGHCYPESVDGERQEYWRGYKLPWVDQRFQYYWDLQLHTTPLEDKAYFYSGTGLRPVKYVRGNNHQFVGKLVCKYGKSTDYGCANIVDRFWTPNKPRTATNTYILARRSFSGLVDNGDSGGPVFHTYTALGTVSGGFKSGSYYYVYYMPINYVANSPLGIYKVQTVN